ncbi:MAG: RHS repeat-associated core domain-containing protein [Bacteroidales bacterium]|nr:RHS repeat-associated core domain-containing protein [Bacteroidales bacterium]
MEHIAIYKLSKTQPSLLSKVSDRLCCGDMDSAVYFYHSDHLGSASWITNGSGNPVQHLQYMPYGEPFVNERSSSYNERFTFTGKERDSETGYSYFGARFYDSDLMTGWLSIDPQSDKFPNISPYAYCNWNPVKLKDQDGEAPVKALVTAAKLVKKAYNIYKKTGKLTASSLKKVGLDELIGIADDINTIFSGDASLTDRIAAGVDLLVGTELNNKGAKIQSSITSKAARREAMRKSGIPTSQQPKSQSKNQSGREYSYEIADSYGTTSIKSVQQQTKDVSHKDSPHWEAGSVKVDPETKQIRTNSYGRPSLKNEKSKVNYGGL